MSGGDKPELRQLSTVTLVAVTSVALDATVKALQASMGQAAFARVLLLSDRAPQSLDGIEWRQIAPIRSRIDYSRFMLAELANHVETSHVLCVQWDGFVIHGQAWTESFLDYDYIGAVWPHFRDGRNVGNGGFSLRSRRLLEACRGLPFDGRNAEDVVICRLFRDRLERAGLRFAPEEVAARFSYERGRRYGNEFGFHGALNLARRLPAQTALDRIRSLDGCMLARNERWEVLRWSILHGRFSLAREMLRRVRDIYFIASPASG